MLGEVTPRWSFPRTHLVSYRLERWQLTVWTFGLRYGPYMYTPVFTWYVYTVLTSRTTNWKGDRWLCEPLGWGTVHTCTLPSSHAKRTLYSPHVPQTGKATGDCVNLWVEIRSIHVHSRLHTLSVHCTHLAFYRLERRQLTVWTFGLRYGPYMYTAVFTR